MGDFYRRAYAYLVGQIDEALSIGNGAAVPSDPIGNMTKLLQIQSKLQQALYTVEEMYLDEEDEGEDEPPAE